MDTLIGDRSVTLRHAKNPLADDEHQILRACERAAAARRHRTERVIHLAVFGIEPKPPPTAEVGDERPKSAPVIDIQGHPDKNLGATPPAGTPPVMQSSPYPAAIRRSANLGWAT